MVPKKYFQFTKVVNSKGFKEKNQIERLIFTISQELPMQF